MLVIARREKNVTKCIGFVSFSCVVSNKAKGGGGVSRLLDCLKTSQFISMVNQTACVIHQRNVKNLMEAEDSPLQASDTQSGTGVPCSTCVMRTEWRQCNFHGNVMKSTVKTM